MGYFFYIKITIGIQLPFDLLRAYNNIGKIEEKVKNVIAVIFLLLAMKVLYIYSILY